MSKMQLLGPGSIWHRLLVAAVVTAALGAVVVALGFAAYQALMVAPLRNVPDGG